MPADMPVEVLLAEGVRPEARPCAPGPRQGVALPGAAHPLTSV